jgi:hypothetical protein
VLKVSRYITREMVKDNQIVVYTLTSMSLDILLQWSKDIQTVLTQWPDNLPYLALHDLSESGVSMPFLILSGRNIYSPDPSPSGQEHVNNFLDAYPDREICLALVLSSSASGRLTKRYGTSASESRIKYKVFMNRDSALSWLLNSPQQTKDMSNNVP